MFTNEGVPSLFSEYETSQSVILCFKTSMTNSELNTQQTVSLLVKVLFHDPLFDLNLHDFFSFSHAKSEYSQIIAEFNRKVVNFLLTKLQKNCQNSRFLDLVNRFG